MVGRWLLAVGRDVMEAVNGERPTANGQRPELVIFVGLPGSGKSTYYFANLAATQAGWYITPINSHLTGPEVAYIVEDCDAKALFCSARTAEAWGLVNAVEPGSNVMGYAINLAQEIAARAPLSVQMTKQLVDSAQGDAETMTLEALAGALSSSTQDGHEGVAAFREHRQPRFTGS